MAPGTPVHKIHGVRKMAQQLVVCTRKGQKNESSQNDAPSTISGFPLCVGLCWVSMKIAVRPSTWNTCGSMPIQLILQCEDLQCKDII